MSRHTAWIGKGKWIVYGLDHAIGYFCDLYEQFDLASDARVIKELCTSGPFANASRGDIIEVMKTCIKGDIMNTEVDEHMRLIALDLPI